MWRVIVALTWLLQRLRLVSARGVWVLPEKTRQLLREADAVEVFSLGGPAEETTAFPGASVLGRVVVTDRPTRRRLVNRILLANRYSTGGLRCLGAEYGVRVVSKDATIDLTFCFDCSKVWVMGPPEYCGVGTTAAFPATLLDGILKDAGVPLPPPREH